MGRRWLIEHDLGLLPVALSLHHHPASCVPDGQDGEGVCIGADVEPWRLPSLSETRRTTQVRKGGPRAEIDFDVSGSLGIPVPHARVGFPGGRAVRLSKHGHG